MKSKHQTPATSATHTPGKWAAITSNPSIIQIIESRPIRGPVGRLIARVTADKTGAKDALLILSAPELLAALQRLTDAFRASVNGEDSPEQAAIWKEEQDALENAESVLARATGGA